MLKFYEGQTSTFVPEMQQYHCRYFMLRISVLSVMLIIKHIDMREKIHLQEVKERKESRTFCCTNAIKDA